MVKVETKMSKSKLNSSKVLIETPKATDNDTKDAINTPKSTIKTAQAEAKDGRYAQVENELEAMFARLEKKTDEIIDRKAEVDAPKIRKGRPKNSKNT
jgi:hypothetical protein